MRRERMPCTSRDETKRCSAVVLLLSHISGAIRILFAAGSEQAFRTLYEIEAGDEPNIISDRVQPSAYKGIERRRGRGRHVEPDSDRPAFVAYNARRKRHPQVRASRDGERVVAVEKACFRRRENRDVAERAVRHFGRCTGSRVRNRRKAADRRRENRRARRIRRVVVVEVPLRNETSERRQRRQKEM